MSDRIFGNMIKVEDSGSILELIHLATYQFIGRLAWHIVRSPLRVPRGLLVHWCMFYTRITVSCLIDRPCIGPLSFYFIGKTSDAPPYFVSALVLEYADRTILYVR